MQFEAFLGLLVAGSIHLCTGSYCGDRYDKNYGNIYAVPATGASHATSHQINLLHDGVRASHQMANTDMQRMYRYKRLIKQAGCDMRIDPAIIAGIMSRETRLGHASRSKGNRFFNKLGFGRMRVDGGIRCTTLRGSQESLKLIKERAWILIHMINKVAAKHPTWSKEMKLKGGISAYRVGARFFGTYERMDIGTTGNDYANNVIARAKWFKSHGY